MGIELEYKLRAADARTLARVLASPEVAALRIEPWRETRMKTTYYDTPDRRFSARRWTLRRRTENDTSIICLKTPLAVGEGRGEWQLEADAPTRETIERLLQIGAPQELRTLYGDGRLVPVSGAEFLRTSAMLEFPDGSRAELAGDCGKLLGATQSLPFTEAELELYRGEPTATKALAAALCAAYGLCEEPLSKFARAAALK